MLSATVKAVATALLFLGIAAEAQTTAAKNTSAATDKSVAEKALQIVSGIHGSWTQMPGNIVTSRMSAGALIGNGSVGAGSSYVHSQQPGVECEISNSSWVMSVETSAKRGVLR